MFGRRIFLLAPSYHGSTLLGRLLHGHPEVVTLGDTYPSNRIDQICGCGVPVRDCQFWQIVKRKVRADRYLAHAAMLPAYPGILGVKIDRVVYNALFPDVVRTMLTRKAMGSFVEDYETFVECVYREYRVKRPAVFVDGVKSISRVVALIAAGADVGGVIHLVRDPGDFAKSMAKHNCGGMPTVIGSAAGWRLYHRAARRLRRCVPYLTVSYEDLVDSTDATVKTILGFIGVRPVGACDLIYGANPPWHFIGNASMLNFDGIIRRSRHELTPAEQRMVRLVAGRELPIAH